MNNIPLKPRQSTQVIIVGAGPTGLFLAYALTRMNIQVKIIDSKPGPCQESRALGVHARTLEFYEKLGLADKLIELGIKTDKVKLWVKQKLYTQFSLKNMGDELSRYPFMLILPQDVHEKFLIEQLHAEGVNVDWNTELSQIVHQDENKVEVLLNSQNAETKISTEYLVGCDGASSTTRKALNIEFSGGTTEGLFYVADVNIDKENDVLNLGLVDKSLTLMIPIKTNQSQRLIGIVPEELIPKSNLVFDDVRHLSEQILNIKVTKVNWFSTYKVHHRVAKHFRVGRCFLAGDACHVHSPVGAQGMNTGIGDSMNLAWKLAQAIQDPAKQAILNTYESERMPFAKQLVATTDAMFEKMVADTYTSKLLRLHLFPFIIKNALRFSWIKKLLFKRISQIKISYAQSQKKQANTGKLKIGDRLPFIASIDNYKSLSGLSWEMHVYGVVTTDVKVKIQTSNIDLTTLPFTPEARNLGILENAVYLIRPDGYIGDITLSPLPPR